MMANDGAMCETKSRYDVFLSFRGEDTRHTFTCHLYHALCRKGIITFMDDGELKFGDQIRPILHRAIEESNISIVVLSENYADSSWCLDELVKILECKDSKNQLVWPIFYKVNPSDVRHQNGSYGEAMIKHEKIFGKDSEKVLKWRSTLNAIADMAGEHLKSEQGRDESKFIDDLVSKIFLKVSPKELSSDEHIVGRDQNKCLEMHDLIQDMGKEIVKEEAWNEIGERSRLWFHEDVLQVLADNMGSRKIQGLMLDPPQREEINCTDTVFEKMKNLRILIVRNISFSHEPSCLPNNLRLLDWKDYPSQSFPSGFYPRKIGAFNLSRSSILVLEEPFKRFQHLTYMNISYCDMVTEFPDVSGAKNLRELRLDGCKKLVSIHESVGLLANLVFLTLPSSVLKVDAKYCYSLTSESSNILWSQVRKEMKRLEVVMPKRVIPEWFDYVSEGGFPVFKARIKFPGVALALVFGEVDAKAKRQTKLGPWRTVGMHLFIQGKRRQYHNFVASENHVLLCDLRVLFGLEEGEDAGFGVGKVWKTIQVFCETNLSLCSWGVYVYKSETNMKDIKFMSQDPSSSLVWSHHKMISDEDKILSKRTNLNLPAMHREFNMRNNFKGQSIRVLEKARRRVMALTDGEGRSGMNIEDENDEEVDSLLDTLAMAEIDKHHN
ncbi:hypothetical protein VNO80_24247 [Phaseolus coccineus]|uniref:TIR domain-containing protein n=1 Tax=Phaseolus coccineus TaxID=3886 RepID=A0AAN9LT84_PHACN